MFPQTNCREHRTGAHALLKPTVWNIVQGPPKTNCREHRADHPCPPKTNCREHMTDHPCPPKTNCRVHRADHPCPPKTNCREHKADHPCPPKTNCREHTTEDLCSPKTNCKEHYLNMENVKTSLHFTGLNKAEYDFKQTTFIIVGLSDSYCYPVYSRFPHIQNIHN